MNGTPNTLATRLMWIAWPAFLAACGLEVAVFALVDPQDLHWHGEALELSRRAVYTLAFFIFWGVNLVSCGLTTLLAQSPFEVNRCPLPADGRPDGCPKQGPC
jgi:hypothetical protein